MSEFIDPERKEYSFEFAGRVDLKFTIADPFFLEVGQPKEFIYREMLNQLSKKVANQGVLFEIIRKPEDEKGPARTYKKPIR